MAAETSSRKTLPYSYQEEAMSFTNAGRADSDLNHGNYNEKDAMIIVIQTLISENLELKQRLLNLQENKCSTSTPAVKESEVDADINNEKVTENLNFGRLKPAKKIKMVTDRSCSYCGDYHKIGKEYCKAYGKICTKCLKLNHFKKMCKTPTDNLEIEKSVSTNDCRLNKIDDPEIYKKIAPVKMKDRAGNQSLQRCKSLPLRSKKQQCTGRTIESSAIKKDLKIQNRKKINPYVSYASVCEKQEKTYTKEKVAKSFIIS